MSTGIKDWFCQGYRAEEVSVRAGCGSRSRRFMLTCLEESWRNNEENRFWERELSEGLLSCTCNTPLKFLKRFQFIFNYFLYLELVFSLNVKRCYALLEKSKGWKMRSSILTSRTLPSTSTLILSRAALSQKQSPSRGTYHGGISLEESLWPTKRLSLLKC